MTKLRVQAQHLKAGDIVGSGEVVRNVTLNSISWPSNKCLVSLDNPKSKYRDNDARSVLWGKYTMIGIERAEELTEAQKHENKYKDMTDEDLGVNDYGP